MWTFILVLSSDELPDVFGCVVEDDVMKKDDEVKDVSGKVLEDEKRKRFVKRRVYNAYSYYKTIQEADKECKLF